MIPSDDPVRLLSAFVEGMDLSELYHTYDRIRKNQASPRQMLKIMVYAAMNGIFSSRDIETACRRDRTVPYGIENGIIFEDPKQIRSGVFLNGITFR